MFLHNHAHLPHISYVNSVFLHEVFGFILAVASLVEDGGKPAILNGVFADSVKFLVQGNHGGQPLGIC